MRFQFSTRRPHELTVKLRGVSAAEVTVRFERRGLLKQEWEWTWIDGREFLWQVPGWGNPGWRVLRDGETVWSGKVHQDFLPWKSRGLEWTRLGEPRVSVRHRRFRRRFRGMQTDDGRLIGAWRQRGCSIAGVIRDSVAADLGAVVIVTALGSCIADPAST